jgi:sugar phosphate permease
MVETVKRGGYRFRYLLVASVTLCYAMQYLDRVKTNVLIPFISKDVGLTNYQIGIGAALMLIFYGPSRLIGVVAASKLVDKRKPEELSKGATA